MTEYAYSRNEPFISLWTSTSTIRSEKSSGGGGVLDVRRAMRAAPRGRRSRSARRVEVPCPPSVSHGTDRVGEAGAGGPREDAAPGETGNLVPAQRAEGSRLRCGAVGVGGPAVKTPL